MEKIIFTAGILLLPAVCTTVGAAGAFLFRRTQEPRTQRMTLRHGGRHHAGGQCVEPAAARH